MTPFYCLAEFLERFCAILVFFAMLPKLVIDGIYDEAARSMGRLRSRESCSPVTRVLEPRVDHHGSTVENSLASLEPCL